MGILTGTTRSEEKYRRIWKAHIDDLASLYLAADANYKEWEEVKNRLLVVLNAAAANINWKEDDRD